MACHVRVGGKNRFTQDLRFLSFNMSTFLHGFIDVVVSRRKGTVMIKISSLMKACVWVDFGFNNLISNIAR